MQKFSGRIDGRGVRIAGGEAERVLLLFLVGVLGFMIFCEVLNTISGEVGVNPGIELAC